MRHRIGPFAVGVSLLALVSCAGQGDVIPIQVKPILAGPDKMAKPVTSLHVVVSAFEDGRQDKTHLGTRSHLWGGVSYFDVPGANPGEVTAQAITDYLKGNGWRAERVKPGGSLSGADVVISGQVMELAVNAKSGIGFTKITADAKVMMQARNVADGSLVRMTLNGAGSDDVFWFDPEDAQSLINQVVTESFDKLVQSTKVDNKQLRLK